MLSVLSAAPYAAGLGLFLVAYFFVIPYVEYLRDPKGKHQLPAPTSHILIALRLEEIPKSSPMFRILGSSLHDNGITGVPIHGAK